MTDHDIYRLDPLECYLSLCETCEGDGCEDCEYLGEVKK